MWPVETWKSIFDWGSIVLICLTVFTGAGALITGKIIIDRQDEKIADLNRRASEAQKETENARERTAGLENQTATLSAQNLKLEAAIAPRRLTTKQVQELESLAHSMGDTVNIESYANDVDGLLLGWQIRDALSRAKVNVLDNTFTRQAGTEIFLGVLIDGPSKDLVAKLETILGENGLNKSTVVNRSSGMHAVFSVGKIGSRVPPSAHIMIGLKPLKQLTGPAQ